jgi:type I restriction enzyme, S subunit
MKAGWQTKKLGEICDIERGGSPRPIQNFITDDPNGINWIKIGDATASGKYIYKTEEKIKPEGVKRSRMVYEGDFILSNSMSFGRPYIMKTSGCIHDGWLVLHQPKVDPDYLYYVLSSDLVFDQFDRLAAGSTVRNLNIGLAKSVEIPYPPLPEQHRIVAVLDEAFDGIATAKATAEKNLQNARALFESHLQSVFTERGEGWVEKSLGELGTITSSKRIFKSEYVKSGVPFYRTKEIKELANGNEITTELFISETRYKEIKSSFGVPTEGDILLTAIGTIGETWVVEGDNDFYFKDGNVLWLKKFTSINPRFLKYVLLSFVESLNKMSHGSAYSALPIQRLNAHRIFLPSLAEQEQIVETLDALRDETQRLESLYQQKLTALDDLKKSLLHQAFSGAL